MSKQSIAFVWNRIPMLSTTGVSFTNKGAVILAFVHTEPSDDLDDACMRKGI